MVVLGLLPFGSFKLRLGLLLRLLRAEPELLKNVVELGLALTEEGESAF